MPVLVTGMTRRRGEDVCSIADASRRGWCEAASRLLESFSDAKSVEQTSHAGAIKLTTEPQTDPALVAMMRCYLSKPRTSWPYLALLLGAMAFLVVGLFLPV
jgi:hypothetical protein